MSKTSKQDSFAREFTSEAFKQGGFRALAGAVGMPDKKDWENIVQMIALYRKKSVDIYGYDILVTCITDARRDYQQNGGKYDSVARDFNLVNKDSNMRYHFELPESFVRWIEVGYPLMFKDLKHYHWFCKNFRELMIPGRF